MMSQINMPSGPAAYNGNPNILGDVSNVLADIESQTNPLDQLEQSLDNVLNPNSNYIFFFQLFF